MKIIYTRKGEEIFVDDEDYDYLNGFLWNLTTAGYARRHFMRNGKKSVMYMHRQIMGDPEGLYIDHENHKPHDNRKSNLRIATNSQNQRNRSAPITNSSGGKCCYYDRKYNVYRVRCSREGKHYYFGTRKTLEEAKQLYLESLQKIDGEFTKI